MGASANYENHPAKVSALVSTLTWGFLSLKSYLGYKASQETVHEKAKSLMKKGLVVVAVISFISIFKWDEKHAFEKSKLSRSSMNLFSFDDILDEGKDILNKDWKKYFDDNNITEEVINSKINESVSYIED